MKRIVLCLLLLTLYPCACFAAFGDADDGYLTAGEYDYGVEIFGDNTLIVDGGGADRIEMWDYSYLEVRNTSVPLSNSSGIWGIYIDDYSELLYLGGETDLLSVYDRATAVISGGTVNMIRSYQLVNDSPHITIECQPDWSWLFTSSKKTGITGLWEDGSIFDIVFIDKDHLGYDPVWTNINIVEIPEPATLALFGLGGLLMRRKR